MGLRRLDAFVKTRPDLLQKTAAGGLVTLVASGAAAALFVGQLYVYIMGQPHHSLGLAKSFTTPLLAVLRESEEKVPSEASLWLARGKLPLRVHVTFPHLNCDQLDITHDGASMIDGELEKHHGKHSLNIRTPTTSELNKIGGRHQNASGRKGCTIDGTLHPNMVAGILQITFSNRAWAEATAVISTKRIQDRDHMPDTLSRFNVSHYIHKIEFGSTFRHSAAKPLEERAHIITNDFGGIAVEQIQVKLVPTVSHGFLFREFSYQTSVVDTTIQPQTLVAHGVSYLPGLVLSYDFTPLQIDHTLGRENFLVFLSSLVSIVAGVFITVGMLTGCLVHSASEIAKKID